MFRRKPAQPAPVDRWLVIGLGNPGGEYERSRHNVGFLVVDELARRHGGRVTDRAAKSLTAAKALRTKYDVPLERVLVVHDELDLPFGRLRIRTGGSSAGNHGLDSVITSFGTKTFPRIRVGVGRPVGDAVDYVLSPFTNDERARLPELVGRVADAIEYTVEHGLERAMTEFNRG